MMTSAWAGSAVPFAWTDHGFSGVTHDSAELHATADSDLTSVTLVWDVSDKGTVDVSEWAHSVDLGPATGGVAFSGTATNLQAGTQVVYRFVGTGLSGTVWSEAGWFGTNLSGKTAGVFYSTLYAYDPAYRMTRITEFGIGADQRLFADVNGDGKEDALAVFSSELNASQTVWRVEAALSDGSDFVNPSAWLSWTNAIGAQTAMSGDVDGDGDEDLVFFGNSGGRWNVALSTGSGFEAPVLWRSGDGVGSNHQFVEDINGDGKADAIISWKTWNGGDWRCALSSGTGFGGFGIIEQNFGDGLTHYVCDLNADDKADLIAYEKASGNWDVSVNNSNGFVQTLSIDSGFGADAEFVTVRDVDNDGCGDLVFVDGDEAWVRYLKSDLSLVEPRHRWITQGRSRWRDLYADAQTTIASMDGSGNGQLFCTYNGTWQAFPPNDQKNTTLQGVTVNTWEVWPSHYLPWDPTSETPNTYGYYDSGDPDVNDAQLKQMHDFGFNYVMLDITNGGHAWVNDRALAFIDRIRHWNENLQPGQRKMYFCIALGFTRQITEETAFFNKLEDECIMAWDQFYADNLDMVYTLNGKPLLAHMLDVVAEAFWPNRDSWAGPRTHIDRMTNRTFRNWKLNTGDAAYGWVVPDETPDHDPNLMTVMPGFSNQTHDHSHNNGLRYKNHWLSVLKADPQSVFVVSWNEDWEQNAIQPAFMHRTPLEAKWKLGKGYAGLEAYTDERGEQMDDYYFVMTRQYLKLFQSGQMEDGTCFKEETSDAVYRATADGFVHQGSMPSQAPVLVLPDGFIASGVGFPAFATRHALVGGRLGDDDSDGLENLVEYALGGNPTTNDAAAVLPVFQLLENSLVYVHNERTDDTSLKYTVLVCTNLVSDSWKTNGVEFVDAAGFSNVWKTVTNRVSTIGKSQQFIRLKIEQE